MEEEKKVVEEPKAEAVEEPKQEEQSQDMTPESKNSLISFILAVVGFGLAWGWLFAIVSVVLGIVSLNFLNQNKKETEQQPYRTFGRIAKPVAIVDIALGAVMFVIYLIVFIVSIVEGAKQ